MKSSSGQTFKNVSNPTFLLRKHCFLKETDQKAPLGLSGGRLSEKVFFIQRLFISFAILKRLLIYITVETDG